MEVTPRIRCCCRLQEQLQLLRGAKPVDDALYIATYLGISVAAGVAGVLVHTPLLKLTAAALALKSGVSARLKGQLSRVLAQRTKCAKLPGIFELMSLQLSWSFT